VRWKTQVGFVYGAIRMTRDWETPDKHRQRQTLAKIMKFSASRRAGVAEKIHCTWVSLCDSFAISHLPHTHHRKGKGRAKTDGQCA